MEKETSKIRLTQFSHGAGCGCKIAPGILEDILKTTRHQIFPGLLVGYEHKDDAAVLDLGDGTAIISTTDFFMPIVDDPYDFGRIASVNAISDVYAMGGKPLLAIGILGWPIDKIAPEWAAKMIEGAKAVCAEAGIPLAGGHSIDCPEPIFGLAVTGKVNIEHLKKNSGAKPGDLIYLTKPLGVGILTTAEKKNILATEHQNLAKDSMLKLNVIGARLSKFTEVHAMTDVTGFGLCGHLLEMCEASEVNATIHYVKLDVLGDCVFDYIEKGAIPGGTHRNWKSYGHKIYLGDDSWFIILADPQTSGGLLVAIDPKFANEFEEEIKMEGLDLKPIGEFTDMGSGDFRIQVV
ncbi:MAG: selenide, water dikinase SelD [Saprospiraceae bacterium]|nr:selenide, water dikinase SelD [Saprospiraceae bacterium]